MARCHCLAFVLVSASLGDDPQPEAMRLDTPRRFLDVEAADDANLLAQRTQPDVQIVDQLALGELVVRRPDQHGGVAGEAAR